MALDPLDLFNMLAKSNIDFFTGVPDSLLKQFCLCVDDKVPEHQHIIAANEGNAIAIASGYHLATGKLPLVYMQNSGLGNAVNPLLSLCDPDVFAIPMVLLIGWRGEPGVHDEPQHVKYGKVQLDLLKAMDISYEILSTDEQQNRPKIANAVEQAQKGNRPFALVVKKGTFGAYKSRSHTCDNRLMTREESLEIILGQFSPDGIVVSTTGKTSREIFEIRERSGQAHSRDFLVVGSMGHCSSVSLGIAVAKPERKVLCIDGDGSLIMHMGSLSSVGKLKPKNFCHILLNNQVHESVGGQETAARFIDFPELVKANGYANVSSADTIDALRSRCRELMEKKGPNFLEVKIKPGSREDLGRPTQTPVKNKELFMEFIRETS